MATWLITAAAGGNGTRAHPAPGARTAGRDLRTRRYDAPAGALREVTDRLRAEQRRFASDASHELRTPLAGLRAQLEEARLHPDQTDLDRLLDAALRDVDRLQAIVADLLLLVEVGADPAARREPVDLTDTVRAEAARRPGCDIRLQAEPALVVDAARTHLTRLIADLFDNASRYADRTIHIQLQRRHTTAQLTITDDGPGIPASDRERIFQPFTRLDTARCRHNGGTGLGLAIARDIAHAHHGTLHTENAPDAGARFVLRLPLARPA
ncbi:sensor histidine kinase [Actinomadura scrupuli]|uniref:sensor histidine kinase n=1 Tax=Actinomadura scrupuli TaxID=559629 RepID=UPI003D96DDD8